MSAPGVKLTGLMLALWFVFASCERKHVSREPVALQASAASVIWVDARVNLVRRNSSVDDFPLLEHRFQVTSGELAAYTEDDVRLEVLPKANGDGTITIAVTLRGRPQDSMGQSHPELAEVTVTDGGSATHQVGPTRFNLAATTSAQQATDWDNSRQPVTLLEGTYAGPPGAFSGGGYTFKGNKVTLYWFSDVGPVHGHLKGLYRMEGKRVHLSFEDERETGEVLNYREIDGVRLLIPDTLVTLFDTKERLEDGFLFLVPPQADDHRSWWWDLLQKHPQFAKCLPERYRQ